MRNDRFSSCTSLENVQRWGNLYSSSWYLGGLQNGADVNLLTARGDDDQIDGSVYIKGGAIVAAPELVDVQV